MNARAIASTIGMVTLALAALVTGVRPAGAEGTETLGPPNLQLAAGSGVAVGGVGLEAGQPGTIAVTIPASASVEQVLVYWEGQSTTPTGDDTIIIEGATVNGSLIGGPTLFFETAQRGKFYSSTYRADITGLGVVGPGANSISVGGLAFDQLNDGAGLLVIYEDGTTSEISLFDGNDLAFINFTAPLDATVPKTFNFSAATTARVANLGMFFSSVAGPDRTGPRPTIIEVTIQGVTTRLPDLLGSNDGHEWDTIDLDIDVPAGATELTVRAVSADSDGTGQNPLAASFVWNAASLSIPTPETPTTTTTTSSTTSTTTSTTSTTTTTSSTLLTTTSTSAPTSSTTTIDATTTTAATTSTEPTNVLPDSATPTSSGPTPTSSGPTVSTTGPTAPGSPPTNVLPATGTDSTGPALGGVLALLAAGFGLVALARRRPPTVR